MASHQDTLPPGWRRAGPVAVAEQYALRIDREVKRSGAGSLLIESVHPRPTLFAGVQQAIDAEPYRGRRVRLRGYMRVSDVRGWAALWMRVDSPTETHFDNMASRPPSGTHEWAQRVIVLDVPSDAIEIVFGALLSGRGAFRVDDLEFDVVGRSVSTTGSSFPTREVRPIPIPATTVPLNLDFEQEP